MRVDEFEYPLPSRHIAQSPLPERDSSRLLVLNRKERTREEARFSDLPGRFRRGDLLVVNDARVRPFRLRGRKERGGRVEITLVKRRDHETWEALVRGRDPKPGLKLIFPGGLAAELIGPSENLVRVSAREGAPLWLIRFAGEPDLLAVIERDGLPPLPPYIKRTDGQDPGPDRERYQTVYAREGEAAAAPTAGLHFTPRLLQELAAAGIEMARVRLDVSFGTFAPVRVAEVEQHRMHPESFALPAETVAAVSEAKTRGSRVIAVGTTAVRVLEHSALVGRQPGAGETSLFIYPGFEFKVVDALITNFHLPKSTLLMLVAAFADREFILDAYRYARESGFRFLSYGDAMLIL